MTAKKRKKSKKRIAPSKTKTRSTKNMQAFVREQIVKTQSRETLVVDTLRALLNKAFERDEALPTTSEIAIYLDLTYDYTRRILRRLAKKKIVINISRDPRKKLFVPNDPEYIGDDA